MLRFRLVFAFTFVAAACATAYADAVPDVETIVSRMEQAQVENRDAVRAYSLTREFELRDGRGKSTSAVTAEVSFVPPGKKSYTINSTTGSDRGEKVVRKVLEGESEVAAATGNSDLTRENYEFAYAGMTSIAGRPCWLLNLEPKQKRRELVRGRACIDTRSYLPRRVEGELAKTPSWWLKQVRVKIDFDDVRGMWLQTGTQAVADVRVLGKHELISRVVNARTAESFAANTAPVLPNRVAAVVPVSSTVVKPAPPKFKKAVAKKHGKRTAKRVAVAKRRAPSGNAAVAQKRGNVTPSAMLGAGVLVR